MGNYNRWILNVDEWIAVHSRSHIATRLFPINTIINERPIIYLFIFLLCKAAKQRRTPAEWVKWKEKSGWLDDGRTDEEWVKTRQTINTNRKTFLWEIVDQPLLCIGAASAGFFIGTTYFNVCLVCIGFNCVFRICICLTFHTFRSISNAHKAHMRFPQLYNCFVCLISHYCSALKMHLLTNAVPSADHECSGREGEPWNL